MGKFPISLTILGMAFQIHSLQSMSQDELLRYVQEFIGKKLQVLLKKDVCVVGTLRVLDSISIHLTEVLIIKLDSRESRSEYWVFLDRIRELEDRSWYNTDSVTQCITAYNDLRRPQCEPLSTPNISRFIVPCKVNTSLPRLPASDMPCRSACIHSCGLTKPV